METGLLLCVIIRTEVSRDAGQESSESASPCTPGQGHPLSSSARHSPAESSSQSCTTSSTPGQRYPLSTSTHSSNLGNNGLLSLTAAAPNSSKVADWTQTSSGRSVAIVSPLRQVPADQDLDDESETNPKQVFTGRNSQHHSGVISPHHDDETAVKTVAATLHHNTGDDETDPKQLFTDGNPAHHSGGISQHHDDEDTEPKHVDDARVTSSAVSDVTQPTTTSTIYSETRSIPPQSSMLRSSVQTLHSEPAFSRSSGLSGSGTSTTAAVSMSSGLSGTGTSTTAAVSMSSGLSGSGTSTMTAISMSSGLSGSGTSTKTAISMSSGLSGFGTSTMTAISMSSGLSGSGTSTTASNRAVDKSHEASNGSSRARRHDNRQPPAYKKCVIM